MSETQAAPSAPAPGAAPIRVVIAKPGLDGHDRGAKVVARALRDAGVEVVYTGLHQMPEQIVATAIQEDADGIGMSILSGAHMTLCPKVVELPQAAGRRRHQGLRRRHHPRGRHPVPPAAGIAAVFTPGTPTQEIVDWAYANLA